ncbi:uncharacterized protein LOC119317137 [Triticum dicoccoides]|uniref:uncharacterized protein LOC119317137 n=1 Tax=Triticum dicoccoides TaxID=85692 RepID=UPI0018914AFB|nr:uncharacterized protein LOC119317137 [Triticum dicoccoides]
MAPSSDLPPGCRFNPHDADLISAYLRPMIAGERLPEPAASFLHSADVYAADPATLVDGHLPAVLVSPKTGDERRYWYFFGSAKARSGRDRRRSRVVGEGKGQWHSEKGRKVVSDEQGRNIGGYKQEFTYKPTNADGSGTEVWLMVEFGADQEDDETGKSIPTLCKIYRSPRKPRSSTPISSTSSTRMRKRKAGDTPLPAPSPVRRRLLVSPAAPILPPPVQTQPDLNNDLDGVSWDELLQDLMSGLTPDHVLGDLLTPVPESNANCSFYMADHAGSAVSSYCDTVLDEGGARMPFPHNSDQVLLGDLFMPVPESEINYSFSMSDHTGSTVSVSTYPYDNMVLHGASVTPFSEISDQADFFMPVFEPQQPVIESQGHSTMLNCSFLPCAPNAGISGSWTRGDTTDDEVASINWYGSAPSSPVTLTEWMMQLAFASTYQF